MIKGCNKRVVVVKDTGNAVIEEAFFILRPGSETGNVSSDNILKHANTILGKSACKSRFSGMNVNATARETERKPAAYFWLGVLFGVASAILVMFIL